MAELVEQPDLRLSFLRPALLPNLAYVSDPDLPAPLCPICEAATEEEPFSESNSVAVRRCPKGHGVWLSSGDLGVLSEERQTYHAEHETSFFEALRRLFGLLPTIADTPKDAPVSVQTS